MSTMKHLLEKLEEKGALIAKAPANTVTEEIRSLRNRYVGSATPDMTDEELRTLRNAYLSVRGPLLHFDIPNFEDVLFCGPDAESAAEEFQKALNGHHGLDSLGLAIATQFSVMDNYDVLILIAGSHLLTEIDLL